MKYIGASVFSFLIFFPGCQWNDLKLNPRLDGKWVDVNTKTDTITFRLVEGEASLILDRGLEMRNGLLLPKLRSGPYEYEIVSDKISLRWVPSSLGTFEEYGFAQSGNEISIENFYDKNLKGNIQVFRRLE